MLLSDKDLKEMSIKHDLVSPFLDENCEGATIDLTLDSQIRTFDSKEKHIIGNEVIDKDYKTIDIREQSFILNPNESVLVQSHEYFKIPNNMAGLVFERYSVKLMGLVVSPSSYMNPGYEGRLSFLLTNNSNGPIQLVAGISFCQLSIVKLTTEPEKPYGEQDRKYMGSKSVQVSKLHLDYEIQQYYKETGHNEISGQEVKRLSGYLMENIKSNAKKHANFIKQNIGEYSSESKST